jgi:hypothetical protein
LLWYRSQKYGLGPIMKDLGVKLQDATFRFLVFKCFRFLVGNHPITVQQGIHFTHTVLANIGRD